MARTAISMRVEPVKCASGGCKNAGRIGFFEAIRISLFEP